MLSRRKLIKTMGIALGSFPFGVKAFSSPKKIELGGEEMYSPLHTPVQWSIPSKRLEVYLWCRFFASSDPTVHACIDFLSMKSYEGFNRFERDFLNSVFEINTIPVNPMDFIKALSKEFFTVGSAFTLASIVKGHDFITNRRGPYVRIISPDDIRLSEKDKTIQFDPLKPEEKILRMDYNMGVNDNFGNPILASLFSTLVRFDKGMITQEEKNEAVLLAFGLAKDDRGNPVLSEIGEQIVENFLSCYRDWVIDVLIFHRDHNPSQTVWIF